MATYLISKEITITRQEGDTADIVFSVPAAIPLTDATVIFQVSQTKTNILFSKTPTPSGQTITITLDPLDTKGRAGTKKWELQITKGGSTIITIGRGDFIIVPELIT